MNAPPRSRVADRAVAALGPGGPLAKGMLATGGTYEVRDGQLAMARAVGEAIERERILLCEAGTGTGKTLAYLVPAVLSGRRIVVSTATKALQEQIYLKDIPLLAEQLEVSVDAVLLKGLNNYLCRRRLQEALLAADVEGRPAAYKGVLARIEAWARESATGDRAELVEVRDDDPVFRDVQSGSDTRIGAGCPFYDTCFVTKLRDAVTQARLIVVNHHLYLADLALRRGGAKQGVIPDHDVVIFDEAHQLEDVATEFFGVRLSTAKFDAVVRDGRRLAKLARFDDGGAFDQLQRIAQAFFGALAQRGGGQGEGRLTVPNDLWTQELRELATRLDAALEQSALRVKQRDGGDDYKEEGGALARRLVTLRNDLTAVTAPGHEFVPWLEVRARSCAIGIAPIDLSAIFRKGLFAEERESPHTIVMTSATLATGVKDSDRFAHLKQRFGLDGFTGAGLDEGCFPSPFDYPTHAGLYVASDLPEPSAPTFVEHAARRAEDLIRRSHGGALVLCASSRNMRGIHAALWQANLPYPLLCQGEKPKHALLAEFRERRDAVLVATMGFWEGVDVPGDALRLVIIDKLPFATPTDPVVSARCRAIEEEGRSSFSELVLPAAAISLKQGFGRLIRTKTDVGIVAVLDPRLRTKGYGRRLLAALPNAASLRTLDDVSVFLETVVGVSRFGPDVDAEQGLLGAQTLPF